MPAGPASAKAFIISEIQTDVIQRFSNVSSVIKSLRIFVFAESVSKSFH